MARKPDTACAVCGELLWTGSTSRPNPVCWPCRRKRLASAPRCRGCRGRMSDDWARQWLRGKRPTGPYAGLCRTCRVVAARQRQIAA